MPISDFLHRATSSKARGSSTPRSQSQSAAASSSNSDRDEREHDEHDEHGDDHLDISESFGHVTSPSGTTLADDDDVPAKDFLPDSKLEISTSVETVAPALEPPVYVSPHASTKPRFLADVHSNAVSLLVRAPHSRRPLSQLGITLGGKRLSDADEDGVPAYTCSQLFENVYLLGLPSPAEGGRLEIALD